MFLTVGGGVICATCFSGSLKDTAVEQQEQQAVATHQDTPQSVDTAKEILDGALGMGASVGRAADNAADSGIVQFAYTATWDGENTQQNQLDKNSSGSLKDDNQGQAEKAEQAEQADKERLNEQARSEDEQEQRNADENERRLAEQKAAEEQARLEREKAEAEQRKKATKNSTTRTESQAENQVSGSLKDNGQAEKHSQNNQTTQTADNAVKSPEVSGSLNKLPTDHLPKGVHRVSVKEIYSTKLCNNPKIELEKMSKVAAQSVPCGANNPYKYGTTPYWVLEWAGHSNNLQGAFDLAQNEKMCQWSDEKTAAEHYIFARLLQNDPESPEWKKIVHRLGLPAETAGYSAIKSLDHSFAWGVEKINKLTGSSFNYKAKTSKPSFLQIAYELKGWTDGWSDNFNQDIKMEFGVCIPPKKGQK